MKNHMKEDIRPYQNRAEQNQEELRKLGLLASNLNDDARRVALTQWVGHRRVYQNLGWLVIECMDTPQVWQDYLQCPAALQGIAGSTPAML